MPGNSFWLSKTSQRRESNPRPDAYEASALPTELRWREKRLYRKVRIMGTEKWTDFRI